MKLPLHLDPFDYTPETCAKRYDHYLSMAQLNPKGFRTMPAQNRNGNFKRGTTKQPRSYRLELLASRYA